MIGLSDLQAGAYEAAREFERQFDAEPSASDIRKMISCSGRDVHRRIARCVHLGFLCYDDERRLIVNEPPHIRAMRQVCEQHGLSADEIRGPAKSLELARARRTLARRLRDLRYSRAAIGSVLNRHESTVHEFINPGYGTRKKHRWLQRQEFRGEVQCSA